MAAGACVQMLNATESGGWPAAQSLLERLIPAPAGHRPAFRLLLEAPGAADALQVNRPCRIHTEDFTASMDATKNSAPTSTTYAAASSSQQWGLGSSGTQNIVKRGVLSDVGPVASEATAEVLLHKPIAIQRAIAIRFCNAKSLYR